MKTFDKNIPLDVELMKLLDSFYEYINIRINVAPSDYQCPICNNDIHFGCIRFSKNTCFYSHKMQKEYGKLENKLNAWLKTNDKNYNKVKGLKDKAQKVFEDIETKWISEEDFTNKYPYIMVEDFHHDYILDDAGYVIKDEVIEILKEEPYEHYEYLLLYRQFKEKCYSYANKVEHLISVRLQQIPLPEKLIGFDTTINNCSLDDLKPAYDILKDNGLIVQGNLHDFFNIFTKKPVENNIIWKYRKQSHLVHFLKLLNDPISPIYKSPDYRVNAIKYFLIQKIKDSLETRSLTKNSFDGSHRPPANTIILNNAAIMIQNIS